MQKINYFVRSTLHQKTGNPFALQVEGTILIIKGSAATQSGHQLSPVFSSIAPLMTPMTVLFFVVRSSSVFEYYS